MTRRTRYFLLGSAGLMAIGLCTGLVAYYGGLPSFTASTTGPQELRYVPAEAALVGYANVRDVMSSDFRQRVHNVIPKHEREQNELEKHTGINIERDVDHVVAALLKMDVPQTKNSTGMVLARGRFDNVKLEALAREHNAVIEEYKGKRLIRPAAETGHARGPAVAFLEPGLIALGDDATLRRAIDTHAGAGQNVTTNKEMMGLIGDVEGASNAWAVGRFDSLPARANLPPQVMSQIPAMRYFVAAGRVNGGISGTLRVDARDDESAKNLRDVVTGILALARLQAGSRPELQAMVQSLQLTGTGKTVALSFSVPAQVIDAFAPKKKPEQGR
jgi:hypothetical protein